MLPHVAGEVVAALLEVQWLNDGALVFHIVILLLPPVCKPQ